MKELAREIVIVMLADFGSAELMRRLSDPFWFQALGCALGFDWHSSGLTTTVCGALKEGIRGMEHELGFFIAGGKGRVSRRTPEEIRNCERHLAIDPETLVYASRLGAKVDSAAVQDGYQLYHHVFLFNREGRWAIIQQGMNAETRYARRYHWLGLEPVAFVCEPHQAVCCDQRGKALNLVAGEGEENRAAAAGLALEHPDRIMKEAGKLDILRLPAGHPVPGDQIDPKYLHKILTSTYERRPGNFEALLGMPGVGAKTLRALSLLAELIYGAKPSYRDPARFSYAHGGKDGHPYPVNREVYDQSIHFLRETVNSAKIGASQKKEAFRRLSDFQDLFTQGPAANPALPAQHPGDHHAGDVVPDGIQHGGGGVHQGPDHGDDREGFGGKTVQGQDQQFADRAAPRDPAHHNPGKQGDSDRGQDRFRP